MAAKRHGAGLGRGTHSVYLALLWHPESGHFSVYVGMTGLAPAQRYDNHKRGHKASKAVERYGVRLLSDSCEHLTKIPYEAAKRIEGELAESLRLAGYSVAGGH